MMVLDSLLFDFTVHLGYTVNEHSDRLLIMLI